MAPPDGQLQAGLALLRHAGFGRLFTARFISAFGSAMAPVAMAFGVLEHTGSPAQMGMVVACQSLGQIVALVFSGTIADRWSRKRVIIGAEVVAALSQCSMAALFFAGPGDDPNAWPFGALMLVNGVAYAFLWPALTGALPQVVQRADLQAANALLAIAFATAMSLGAASAGMLVATYGAGVAITADAMTFLTSALLISQVSFGPQVRGEAASFVSELADGWKEFRSHRWLWAIVAQFSLVVAGYQGGLFIVGPIVSERMLGGAQAFGWIFAAMGLGQVAGGLYAIRMQIRRPMLFAVFLVFFFALPLIAFATTESVALIAGCAFLAGVAGELFAVLWYTALHTRVAPDKLSRVTAYDSLGSMAFAPLGEAAAGPLVEGYGTRLTLWLAVALIVIPTILVLGVRDVRTLGTEDDDPANPGAQPSSGTA